MSSTRPDKVSKLTSNKTHHRTLLWHFLRTIVDFGDDAVLTKATKTHQIRRIPPLSTHQEGHSCKCKTFRYGISNLGCRHTFCIQLLSYNVDYLMSTHWLVQSGLTTVGFLQAYLLHIRNITRVLRTNNNGQMGAFPPCVQNHCQQPKNRLH